MPLLMMSFRCLKSRIKVDDKTRVEVLETERDRSIITSRVFCPSEMVLCVLGRLAGEESRPNAAG